MGPNNSGKSNILRSMELVFKKDQSNDINCREDDMHGRTPAESGTRKSQFKSPDGLLSYDYRLTESEREQLVRTMCSELLPLSDVPEIAKAFRDGNETLQKRKSLESALGDIYNLVLSSPLRKNFILHENRSGSGTLSPNPPVPSWLESIMGKERDKAEKIEEQLNPLIRAANELVSAQILRTVFPGGLQQIVILSPYPVPIAGVLSEEQVSNDPEKYVALSQFRKSTPEPRYTRHYLLMLKEDEQRGDAPENAFSAISDIVKTAFPDIGKIDARLDPEYSVVDVFVTKGEECFELGSQGDGLKQILRMFSFLGAHQGDLVIIDEPETHLHPSLERRLLEFFLKYGKGQLVIGTHSAALINSIESEWIESGDIVVHSLSLSDKGVTKTAGASKPDLVSIIDSLGLSVDRYIKHMAAHARTLVFTEGPSDGKYLELILRKFNMVSELSSLKPYFISYGGKENTNRVEPEILDKALKADESVQTQKVPILVVRDRDESRREEFEKTPNYFMWSVREIENLVISKNSIYGVARKYFQSYSKEFNESVQKAFTRLLALRIKEYLPKLALLRLLVHFGRYPMVMSALTVSSWDDAQRELDSIKSKIESYCNSLMTDFSESSLQNERDELLRLFFPEGEDNLDFEHSATNIPGKDFITEIMPDALIDTLKEVDSVRTGEQTKGKSRAACSFQNFLDCSTDIHTDVKRFLESLRKLVS